MTSRRARLQEDTNFRLMQLLHDNPHVSQREMAKALGLSFGGINYCLNALIEKCITIDLIRSNGAMQFIRHCGSVPIVVLV